MSLVVFSKTQSSCVQCTATYRWLKKHDVPYEVESLEENPGKTAEFKELGHMQAPIVVDGDKIFSGFNPGELAKLL